VGFKPRTAALSSVLEMNYSWKEIYISKMNFINPEFNFINETRKIKTRDIHNSKNKYRNDISKQHFPFLKWIILGNIFKFQI
jgi:hypothetical protein